MEVPSVFWWSAEVAQPAKRNELLRKSENMLSMVSELAFGTDISVESDALDAEFLAEIGNWSIALGHGGLRETHLSFGEREFSSALATARSRGGETRHGALSDQIPLELGELRSAYSNFYWIVINPVVS